MLCVANTARSYWQTRSDNSWGTQRGTQRPLATCLIYTEMCRIYTELRPSAGQRVFQSKGYRRSPSMDKLMRR
eukprot:6657001-Karenia_brevis.AAC.1